ncbi:MAG: transposase family protein [Candidatus Competibacteraceae bacterium]|nr:transposase family protein [Candidatus Competibacteraceae bacterium]
MLNQEIPRDRASVPRKRISNYSDTVVGALIEVWGAANQICSKRLVPFLPEFVPALERSGYLKISPETRAQLLSLSAATVDRILKPERRRLGGGRSTTKRGSLLKKQIPVRTFADWNDVVAGFVEADLVAHCGETVAGTFLNSLVLTDIATTWTEILPIMYKNEANVLEALQAARNLLPFSLKGLDTDNGSEFINNALLGFCQKEHITFTRSRPYKKNDQAHVEEKNGSIVRRMIGYDRYEGARAYTALAAVYEKLRLYVNFFQPSMKLLSKERIGAKVVKKYDKAKTPYQRVLASSSVPESTKKALRSQMLLLDPVLLFKQIEALQEIFWKHAWKRGSSLEPYCAINAEMEATITNPQEQRGRQVHCSSPEPRRYRKTGKPRKKMEPRTWKTRPDVFESVAAEIKDALTKDPNRTASAILQELQVAHPGRFEANQRRTLQRRVATMRQDLLVKEQAC